MRRFHLSKLAVLYLLSVGIALFLIHAFPPPGNIAYLSAYGTFAAWLLTLPWSLLLAPLMWALFHDSQNILFSGLFVVAAGANCYLINRLAGIMHKSD